VLPMATPCSTWLSGETAFKFSIEISFCCNDNFLFLRREGWVAK
jgi:hypothetical protein